jgi:cytoskeletal protein CcmA (bactofilin family)
MQSLKIPYRGFGLCQETRLSGGAIQMVNGAMISSEEPEGPELLLEPNAHRAAKPITGAFDAHRKINRGIFHNPAYAEATINPEFWIKKHNHQPPHYSYRNQMEESNMNGWKRTVRIVMLAMAMTTLLSLGITGSASAAEFRDGEVIIIQADEVIEDDLFITAERIDVHGTIKGDLFAMGGIVVFDGQVEGSLIIMGQSLTVDGRVDGSLYGAGYSLDLGSRADIARNVYFGGFSLTTAEGSMVGRGLHVGGYQALLSGEVQDDVRIGSATLELEGVVGGDVRGEVGEESDGTGMPFIPVFPGSVQIETPGLRIGDEAQVGGRVDVEIQKIEVQAPKPEPTRFFATLIGNMIRNRVGEFIALLIVGGLLLWLWPSLVQGARQTIQRKPLPSAGWGCLITLIFYIGLPVAIVILILLAIFGGLITFGQLANDILGLGGALLALISTVFLTTFYTITKVVVSYLVGRLILKRIAPHMVESFWSNFGYLALGALIYELLRAIPFGFGWLVSLVVILIGLGALYFTVREMIRPTAPTPDSALEQT